MSSKDKKQEEKEVFQSVPKQVARHSLIKEIVMAGGGSHWWNYEIKSGVSLSNGIDITDIDNFYEVYVRDKDGIHFKGNSKLCMLIFRQRENVEEVLFTTRRKLKEDESEFSWGV